MGRAHTFYDRVFNRSAYNPSDRGGYDPNTVFVIMPYSGVEMDQEYTAIKEECRKLGLIPQRADEFQGSGIVINEITDFIERAEFIICDLTYERPNVYYELGYAHGVGNESWDVLLIAREGTTLHFDIAPLRTRFYSSLDDLRIVVSQGLRTMIEMTRRGP